MPSHAQPAIPTRRGRRSRPFRTRFRARLRARTRNRRRNAPRSAVLRRMLALALAACAALLVIHEQRGTAAMTPAAATESAPELIPVVLPISDPATVSVLKKGDDVDIYAAFDDQPPQLIASALPLLRTDTPANGVSRNGAPMVHIVVGITPQQSELVEDLLAARLIVATVSAVPS